ncbi:hypothetical protein [Streptomyces sp. NBC_00075]|uniref:hypothetical protein n=1 Tax=Streptomyces sp. NBC_00075 TaxID=2975641 RepID=UPI003867A059
MAVHPSDLAVASAALEAVALVAGPSGIRQDPMGSFHRLPAEIPRQETTPASTGGTRTT